MTQSQKLKKIVIKAVENGFMFNFRKERDWEVNIFYKHNFAKAFWGEENIIISISDYEVPQIFMAGTIHYSYQEGGYIEYTCAKWQYHIQELAITPEDERIDYLYSFV